MAADLHIHTPASDGTDSIEKRIEQAENQGLKTIAITDHDSINPNLGPRSEVYDNSVEVITGAEIKCQALGKGIEILGYFLDPEDEDLQELFDRLDRFRADRMKEMTEKVNKELSSSLSYEDVAGHAEGPIGRPHLAQAVVDEDLADSVSEVFNQYIGDECSCYVETEKLDAGEVISLIEENGRVSSLAHPGRDLALGEAKEVIPYLKGKGLNAIEVPYTYQHKRQEGYGINFGVMDAQNLAEKYDLLISGGSDCHGEETDKFNIGKIRLDDKYVEALRNETGFEEI